MNLCLKTGLSDAFWSVNTDQGFSSVWDVHDISHPCGLPEDKSGLSAACSLCLIAFFSLFDCLFPQNAWKFFCIMSSVHWLKLIGNDRVSGLRGTNRQMNSCMYKYISSVNRLKTVPLTWFYWFNCLRCISFLPNAACFSNHLEGLT